jgi:hypothetical protein
VFGMLFLSESSSSGQKNQSGNEKLLHNSQMYSPSG